MIRELYEWKCPECGTKWKVPSTEGLTVCIECQKLPERFRDKLAAWEREINLKSAKMEREARIARLLSYLPLALVIGSIIIAALILLFFYRPV